jgi:hypothetical protein
MRIGTTLSLIECLVGATLITLLIAVPATIGAMVLLVGFSVAAGIAVARREDVVCDCFGSSDSAPVSAWTLIRNAILLGVLVASALETRGLDLGRVREDPMYWAVAIELLVVLTICVEFIRLRSLPGYVRYVPQDDGELSEVWQGTRERHLGRR